MDAGQIPFGVVVELHEAALLPITQRAENILLCVVEGVGDLRDTGGSSLSHLTQQIQIDLDLRVIGVLHIFVDKKIGYDSGTCLRVIVNRKQLLLPPIL